MRLWQCERWSAISTDIERTYGQRKLLAHRTPLFPTATPKASAQQVSDNHTRKASAISAASAELSTPSVTEGESAAETDGPQTEYEDESDTENETPGAIMSRRKGRQTSSSSYASEPVSRANDFNAPRRNKSPVSQHDLFNRYFRKDAILLHNIDLLR